MVECYIVLTLVLDLLEKSDGLADNLGKFHEKLSITNPDLKVKIKCFKSGDSVYRDTLRVCLATWIERNGRAATLGVLYFILQDIGLISTAETLEKLKACHRCKIKISSCHFKGQHVGSELRKTIPTDENMLTTAATPLLPLKTVETGGAIKEDNNNMELQSVVVEQGPINAQNVCQPMMANGRTQLSTEEDDCSTSDQPSQSIEDLNKNVPRFTKQHTPPWKAILAFYWKYMWLSVGVIFILLYTIGVIYITFYMTLSQVSAKMNELEEQLHLCQKNAFSPPISEIVSNFPYEWNGFPQTTPTQPPTINGTTTRKTSHPKRNNLKILNLETFQNTMKAGKCKFPYKIHLILDEMKRFPFTHPDYGPCLFIIEILEIVELDIDILDELLSHLPNLKGLIFRGISEFCSKSTPTHLFVSSLANKKDATFPTVFSIIFLDIMANCNYGLGNLASIPSLRGAWQVEYKNCSLIDLNISKFAYFLSVSVYPVKVSCCGQNCRNLLNYDDKLSEIGTDKECSFFSKELFTVRK